MSWFTYLLALTFPEVSIDVFCTPADFISKLVPDNNPLELIAPSAAIFPEASMVAFVTPFVWAVNAVPCIVELAQFHL